MVVDHVEEAAVGSQAIALDTAEVVHTANEAAIRLENMTVGRVVSRSDPQVRIRRNVVKDFWLALLLLATAQCHLHFHFLGPESCIVSASCCAILQFQFH